MRAYLRPALILLGVFVLGGMAGAGLTVAWGKRHLAMAMRPDFGHRGEMALEIMTHELSLSGDQQQKVRAIVDAQLPGRRERMAAIMKDCGAPLREHKAQMDAAIRAVLTPDQQKKFDKIAARQAERLFFGGDGEPPPGGHGRGRGGF
jgi:Spy/CpxP family protein refolding chaperone